MKVNESPRLHQSTAGQGIKMSIDESATAHIMDVLTKLYADPLQAVIREYSTNAWDSHQQAGVDEPISVTLPTSLAPVLTIRDHGLGLDADDIADIYSRYGTSTKRESNEAVGMLGLGCKSALSYTSQFTLEGRKDGQKVAVIVSRDEDGAGSMTPVDISPTDEPNGVTVTVPIKTDDIPAAVTKAYQFFAFWSPEDVLVNGNPLTDEERLDGIWLNEHILLTKSAKVEQDLVVMGNVAYPLVDGVEPLFTGQRGYRREWNAVCFVPIGAVNFAPSRESLMTTRRTTATLDKLRATVKAEFNRSIEEQIANATSAKEAQELLIHGKEMGFDGKALYKGREVVLRLTRTCPTKTEKDWRGQDQQVPALPGDPSSWSTEDALKYSYLHTNESYYARKTGDRSYHLDLKDDGQWIFTGFDGKAMTNVKRAKLELWFAQRGDWDGTRPPHCVFVDKLSPDEKFWTKGWQVHNWADVAAIELPKAVTADGGTTRLKGSYDAIVDGTREEGIPAHKLQELAKSRSLYWIHGNLWTTGGHRVFRTGAMTHAGCIVVALGANRIEKFCRDFPAAKELEQAARDAAERWVKQQDKELIKAYTIQRHCQVDQLKKLDASKLDDPALVKLHGYASRDVSSYIASLQKYATWASGSKDAAAEKWADKLLASYPLLPNGRYDRIDHAHTILYLNAVYEARQKGGI